MSRMILARLVGALPLPWIKRVSRAQWRHPLLKRAFDRGAALFRNRDGRIQRGAGAGLRFNAGRANAGYLLGTSEPLVQETLRGLLAPGMTYWDVGANVGFLALIAARLVGPQGRVVCFEPLPASSQQIEHNARLNGFDHIAVRSEAVGALDGSAELVVDPEPTWCRLRTVAKEIPAGAGQIVVPLRRLDTFLDADPARPPQVVKVDVEGAEVDVLAGARRLLAEVRPVLLVELHGTNAAVADLLAEAGYEIQLLGSDEDVRHASWDAYVLARPSAPRPAPPEEARR